MQKLTLELSIVATPFRTADLRSGIRSELQELTEHERDFELGLQSLRNAQAQICNLRNRSPFLSREPDAPGTSGLWLVAEERLGYSPPFGGFFSASADEAINARHVDQDLPGL